MAILIPEFLAEAEIGTDVQVAFEGRRDPVSGTLRGVDPCIVVESPEWTWRIPVGRVTAWAVYGRPMREEF